MLMALLHLWYAALRIHLLRLMNKAVHEELYGCLYQRLHDATNLTGLYGPQAQLAVIAALSQVRIRRAHNVCMHLVF